MILSSSYEATLVLLAAATLCWGLWANTQKAARKWRYELYYLDFALGFALFSALIALTLGSLNSKELTFQDNLAIAGYRKIAYCLVAGFLFGLATNLLSAAVALAGMAVAFMISMGLGAVMGIGLTVLTGSRAGVVLQSAGAAAILAAVVISAYTHGVRSDAIREALENTPLRPDPRDPRNRKIGPPAASRGILVSLASGILIGLFRPVLDLGRQGDDSVGPYGAALMFGLGLLAAALFFLPILCNFPVRGRSLHTRDYFTTGARNHILGLLGGLLGAVAVSAALVASAAPAAAQPAASLGFALGWLNTVVAALSGLFVWNEFRAADGRTTVLFGSAVILFAVGLGMAAVGQ